MTNVYVPTKAGELGRLYPNLARAGFSRVPLEIIKPPFSMAKYAKARDALQRKVREDGPFLPYIMMRNNGKPQGTGEGRSEPVFFDIDEQGAEWTFHAIMESDKNTVGVIMQPFVGQRLNVLERVEDEKIFAPLMSGIAHTESARDNMVIMWNYGHPSQAVGGGGHYLAFNKATLERELGEIRWQLADAEVNGLLVDKDIYNMPRLDIRPFFTASKGKELSAGSSDASLLRKVMLAVLNLSKSGSLYVEWALTRIGSDVRLFALQIAEPIGLLPGLPTWMHNMLREYQGLATEARIPGCDRIDETEDYGRLKKMYGEALEKPETIAVSFDAVGEGSREYGILIWKPDILKQMGLTEKPAIVAYKSSIDCNTPQVLGILSRRKNRDALFEISRGGENSSLRGHVSERMDMDGLLGMGRGTVIEHRLREIVEAAGLKWSGYGMRIFGKFSIKTSEKDPFAVLEAHSVERVEDIYR